jgi:hypothetical protein
MSLAMFGAPQDPAKLLAQAQKKLLKLQEKPNQTPAVLAQEAGLQAEIQVLQGGGSVDDAKKALAQAQTQSKKDSVPPVIPPLPSIPAAPETNIKPYVIGGAVLIGGLALMAFLINRSPKAPRTEASK